MRLDPNLIFLGILGVGLVWVAVWILDEILGQVDRFFGDWLRGWWSWEDEDEP